MAGLLFFISELFEGVRFILLGYVGIYLFIISF